MLLSVLALVLTLAPVPRTGVNVPLVHGGANAPWAWAAIADGALWVCWEPDAQADDPENSCWTRVVLDPSARQRPGTEEDEALPATTELPKEPPLRADLRLAFVDAATLVIGGHEGPGWVLLRGQTQPDDLATVSLDPGSVVLETPRIMSCSPTGWLPVRARSGWGWVAAPCDGLDTCLARRPRLRRHLPSGVRVSLAAEIGSVQHAATPATTTLTSDFGTEMLLSVVIRFDPGRLRRDRRALEGLRAQSRPRLRQLPSPGDGPLAATERSALRQLLCARSSTSW